MWTGQGRELAWPLVIPGLLVLFAVGLYPILYVLVMAFSQAGPGAPLRFVGLANFAKALASPRFWHGIYVTGLFMVVSVSIQLVLGFWAAMALYRAHRKVRQLATTVLLVPMMIAPAVVGILWKMMFKARVGLLDYLFSLVGVRGPEWLADRSAALAALIIADVWEWTPFMVILLLAGLQSLKPEIFEAAYVDGSNSWQAFRNMTLPLMKPFIFLAVFLRMVEAWKAFDLIFAITRGGPGDATESIAWYTYKVGFAYFDFGLTSALSVLQLLVIIFLGKVLLGQLARVSQESRAR